MPSEESSGDFNTYFKELRPQLKQKIEDELLEKRAVKWYGVVDALVSRITQEGDTDYTTTHFRSANAIELIPDTIEEHMDQAFHKMMQSFEEYTGKGSGWTLEKITKFKLYTATYHPLAPSSHMKLPEKLAAKKAIVNIKNNDQKCFIWSVLAHKYNIQVHPERVSHYEAYEREIKMAGVQCPVPISKIPIIERANNLRINVYGYDEEVFPLHISEQRNMDCINLLYISEEDNQHYCLIRSMSRLLGDLTVHNGRRFYCERCLHRFSEERLLEDHLQYCRQHAPQKIRMPTQDERYIEFTNVHYQQALPYVIYADFESLIVKMDEVHTANDHNSFTEKIAHHEACGYAYIIIGPDGKSHKPISVYRGPNAIHHFLQKLLEEEEELADIITRIAPMIMTDEDKDNFKKATHCSLCKKPLDKDRVRDHDHITGLFRGALHNACNLNFRLQKKIPVIFHNLKNYDGHLIMQQIAKIEDYDIHVIPNTMEKYISFSLTKKHNRCKVTLQFLDSFQFMSMSLEKLVSNLSPDKFNILNENISQHVNLLLRKGVYPYEHMDSFSKFEETELPPIEVFKSTLSGQSITDEDYEHAKNVWRSFNLRNMGDYHNLYVKSDVLQLADVFENFRKLCLSFYEIDCVHLVTAPGLAWQSCLKMVNQPLELLTDDRQHLMIESGVRGGISTITKRWAQANNKYLPKYNAEEVSKYIMYLDANNLYGWAMSQFLPYGEFQWMSADNITADWILSIAENSPVGYIFEVDLQYPADLHDDHNDYPLAPEKMEITYEDLSPYSKSMLPGGKYARSRKLVPNLHDKKQYITYYKNLQFYLRHGLRLEKVYKVLSFAQKPWLKNYIDFNTEQRKNAKSPFEKDFFKLMNNSVYGKTMENIRNRVDVQLVTTEQKAKKLVSAPSFKRFKIFDNELVAIERLKKTLILNKPIYVGFVILELSKVLMYDFHYNVIKKDYAERASLLFTDTDSLTYEIITQDIYEDMAARSRIYDTSDYPEDHPLYSTENKKKIGCFKDELNSQPIIEFIGLRPKMYSILWEHGEKKTAKGGVTMCREKSDET